MWEKIKDKHHFSNEVLYKLITPSLFPQYDKIIVSDVDVVFLGSVIEEFEDFDSEQDHLVGGVLSNDPQAFFPIPHKGWRSGYRRFSASELEKIQYGIAGGYLIINTKQWRLKAIEQKALDYLNQNWYKLVLPEQDVISICCHPYIKKIHPRHIVCHENWERFGERFQKLIPNIYSQKEITEMCYEPIQLHYVGDKKPWNTPSVPKSELWFEYLCKTPFLRDFLKKFEKTIINNYKKSSLTHRLYNKIKALLG